MNIEDNVNKFYEENGISALNFKCEHYKECNKEDNANFTTAKESYIGDNYGKNGVPKLVFLSLDSGDSQEKEENRTMAFIKQKENDRKSIGKIDKKTHWYKTYKLANSLLKDLIKEEMEIEKYVNKYFAHVNSAKCCQNKKGNSKADDILFKNCKNFIGQEITILNPNIIITQGDEAREALEYNAFKTYTEDNITEIQMKKDAHKILWFHSTHPAAWQNNNFINFEKKHFSKDDNNSYFAKWRDVINTRFGHNTND